ncbi:uncharacterized protein LOC143916071 [Arctopsyche grandis]|uniref:uncharacterized protein LOC143916071 n=1 Tax=Arctopsyche grandis TaxID=121162 RepID=UPI00406D8854
MSYERQISKYRRKMTQRIMKAALLGFMVISLSLGHMVMGDEQRGEHALNNNNEQQQQQQQQNRSQRQNYDKKEKVGDSFDANDHVINKYVDNAKSERIFSRKHYSNEEQLREYERRLNADRETMDNINNSREESSESKLKTTSEPKIFSDEVKATTKEKLLVPLENPGSIDEARSIKQGVPFYIAQDGKSIQLPKSDVIYNSETGDIVIRQNSNKKTTNEDHYNAKPEGFKSLQGFVIADSDGSLSMPLLYPVASHPNTNTVEPTTENILQHSSEADVKNDTMENSMEESNSAITEEEEKFNSFESNTEVPQMEKSEVDSGEKDDSRRVGKKQETTSEDWRKKSNQNENGRSFDSEGRLRNYHDSLMRTHLEESNKNDEKFIEENDNTYRSDEEPGITNRYSSEEITTLPSINEMIPNTKVLTSDDLLNENDSIPRKDNSDEPPFRVDLSQFSNDHDDLQNPARLPVYPSLEDITDMYYVTTTTQQPDPIVALRAYLEDIYLRGPIAVVIDTSGDSLAMAKDAWSAMEQTGGMLNITDIVLIAYDNNGEIAWMSHHKASNPQQVDFEIKSFKKALSGLKPSKGSGRPLQALLKASRLLPYDSAIFLFSNKQKGVEKSDGEDRILARTLLSKRIKLYAVCGDDGCATRSSIRGTVARASGGASVVLAAQQPQHLRNLRALDVYYDASEENNDEEVTFDDQQTIMLRKGLTGLQTIALAIDSSIKTLTISITGNPERAILYTPSDHNINLLEKASVSEFSEGSEILSLSPTAAARLVMILDNVEKISDPEKEVNGSQEENGTEKTRILESGPQNGVWRLTVKGSDTRTFDVQADAETTIQVSAKLFTQYTGLKTGEKNLKIAIGGTVKSVREAILVDPHGQKIAKLSSYKYQDSEMENDATEIESLKAFDAGISSKIVPLPSDVPKDRSFYVQITGRNNNGDSFVRMSQELTVPYDDNTPVEEKLGKIVDGTEIESEGIGRGFSDIQSARSTDNSTNKDIARSTEVTTADGLPLTTIQIGGATRLYGAPGAQMQIHYEITNNRDKAVFYRFGAKDEQYFLRTMNPQSQWISGKQTLNVVVTIGITSSADNNIRDAIKFTASGVEQTSIYAYIYVVSDRRVENDGKKPTLKYSYRGDCMGYLDSSSCSKKTWGLDITARDSDSGLLRIASSPGGIVYQSGFYAGGREEVSAKYTSSCCASKVQLSAVDLNGNVMNYDIDVSQYFTPAMIAAIVLGVLLLIALIVVAILVIRWIVKRKRDSRELPSYQTQRVA